MFIIVILFLMGVLLFLIGIVRWLLDDEEFIVTIIVALFLLFSSYSIFRIRERDREIIDKEFKNTNVS